MKIKPFKKHILATELVEDGIKLAVLQQSKREKRIIHLEFFTGSDQELKEKISKFLKEKNLRFSRVIASISRYIVSSRYITLPSVNYREIEDMIPFQIRRLFPYTAEDVVFSFDILDTDDKGFSRVILFVAQRERVEKFLSLFDDLKLRTEVLTISSWGIINWYLAQNKKIGEINFAIADIVGNSLEFCVVGKKEKIVYSRATLLAGQSNITEEIKRCFDVYNKEPNLGSVSKLILIGEEVALAEIAKSLADVLALKTEIISPRQGLSFLGEKKTLEKYAKLSWVSLMGLLTQVKPSAVNLLTAQVKAEIQEKSKIKGRNKTILIFLLLLSSLYINIAQYISVRSQALEKIEKRLSVLKPEADRLSNMKKKAEFVNEQVSQRFLCIKIINELYGITPEGVFLHVFTYEKGNQVILKGIAKQTSLVFNYVGILEKSEFLKNAQVRFATIRNIKEQEFTDFEIFCEIERM